MNDCRYPKRYRSRWISCDKQLPQSDDVVLITIREKKTSKIWVDRGYYAKDYKNWDYYWRYPILSEDECEITHWKELPLPPDIGIAVRNRPLLKRFDHECKYLIDMFKSDVSFEFGRGILCNVINRILRKKVIDISDQ